MPLCSLSQPLIVLDITGMMLCLEVGSRSFVVLNCRVMENYFEPYISILTFLFFRDGF